MSAMGGKRTVPTVPFHMDDARRIFEQLLPSAPRSLRDPAERERRRGLLNMPHVAALTRFVEELRLRDDAEYPYFDPLDGGTEASLLFLYEKPGPLTAADENPKASGFISRDNDDPTAEATFRFMQEAAIRRAETITWNVIPGWNGTRRITSAELHQGIRDFERLLPLLPQLRSVVLVGKRAARAERFLTTVPVFFSDHPSPLVRARYPDRWRRIPKAWLQAAISIQR